MTASDPLSRLRAGLAEVEGAANFALELERPYHEMTDQTVEIDYRWVRHTRLSNGGSGSMFVDGAPAPHDVLRQVEAIRKVIAEHGRKSDGSCEVCRDYDFRYDYDPVPWPCPTIRALASIYPDDVTEGLTP